MDKEFTLSMVENGNLAPLELILPSSFRDEKRTEKLKQTNNISNCNYLSIQSDLNCPE